MKILILLFLLYGIRILQKDENKIYYLANNKHGCEIYGTATIENKELSDSLIYIKISDDLDKLNFNECKF